MEAIAVALAAIVALPAAAVLVAATRYLRVLRQLSELHLATVREVLAAQDALAEATANQSKAPEVRYGTNVH